MSAETHEFDCQHFLSKCSVHKIEICEKKEHLTAYINMPEVLNVSEYRLLKAHFKEELARRAPQEFKSKIKFSLVPVYPNADRRQAVGAIEVLCDILDDHFQVNRYSRFLHAELKEDSIRLECSNPLVYHACLEHGGFVSALTDLLGTMCGSALRVDPVLVEPEKKESVPDDYFMRQKASEPVQIKAQKVSARASGHKKQASAAASADTIKGKRINAPAVAISEVTDEESNVVVAGKVFETDRRDLKSGRALLLFALTDHTDSISCKVFADKDEADTLMDAIKAAGSLKVRGKVQYDTFTDEIGVIVYDINKTTLRGRTDQAEEKRLELHLHTRMSNMDGMNDVGDLIKLAVQFGHKAIAITDHGVLQAFPDAYSIGQKLGIKILYGVEAYIFDDEEPLTSYKQKKTYHCIILAKNMTGLRNLYRLVTESHLRYFYRRPRIPKRLINYAREGLVVGSACEAGELMRYLVANREDWEGLKELGRFYDYIEIQPIANNAFMKRNGTVKDDEELRELNKTLFRLGKELGKPVVATCDVHFANPEDSIYRAILMKARGFNDAEQQAPLYYHNTEEMLEEFSYLGQEEAYNVVVRNPNAIADSFEEINPVPTRLHPPHIDGAEEQIRQLTLDKAHRLYGDPLPDLIEKRIDKELNSIINNGYAVLYLIAHKLVKNSNENGYIVGSRGSVGSSVVAYFTDITEVNALPPHYRCPKCQHSIFDESGTYGAGVDMPDKCCPVCGSPMAKDGFDIPFEIFLGFKGDKIPDIDLNFSGDYQSGAHSYTEQLFGQDNVFRAGTIATVAEKTAYGYVVKYYEEQNVKKREAEVNRLKFGCTGVKRTTGQHPGGLVVVPKGVDVHNFTPLQRPADDVKTETVTTHFDYHKIEKGLVKLDILGHDDPTVIKMLKDLTGIDPTTVPLDDKATLSLFSSTEALDVTPEALNTTVATYGIPEYNTSFVRQMLDDTQPSSFSDLLRISGFSHGTDVWLNNAQDLIVNHIAPVSETISTRDDIMLYLIQHGMEESVSFKIMEGVRKGRGLKEDQEAAMHESHIAQWYIDSCKKIKYLFPKAHAVAYVTQAYRIAWFKINQPLAFYASYFTVRGIDDFDLDIIMGGEESVRTAIKDLYGKETGMSAKEKSKVTVLEVALELFCRGFEVLPIDIEKSQATKFSIVEGKLLPPFVAIAGLGASVAEDIVKGREERPYMSLEDLKKRGKVNDAVIEKFKSMGIVQKLPEMNQISLF
jgi:DNA polymerase-3 subunit alpha (Gram-positive type)